MREWTIGLLRRCVFLGVVLVGIWYPAPAQAVPPTVTNNSIMLATGAKKIVYLHNSTQWTGATYRLTYTIVDNPQRGTLTFPYLNYGYTHYCDYQADQSGYVGPDSFTWCASSGSETSGLATCTVTIITNSVPAALPYSCTTASGVKEPLVRIASLVTHASADAGQMMTYAIVTPPAHGTASMDMDPLSEMYGVVDYMSAPGFTGTDAFSWTVSDGFSTSAPATVTITVVPNPPVVTNQTVVTVKNTPITMHSRFSGGGGYTCSVIKVSGPSHGTATLTNETWFYYKPASNYVGNDSFQWKIAYSNATTPATNTTMATCSIVVKNASTNADWTQWRFDECRSAQSPAILPDLLYLQWRRDLPTCGSSFAYSAQDIDYCRPVQLGKTLFVSLMASDSVTAYDTDTGAQKWRYYAGGALRRPPVAVALTNGTNVVIFGCDDGYVYCLNAVDGSEVWKFRAAPNVKKAMGFGRLSSVWPVWASPTAYNGRVYLAAGFVPTYGIYVYCLDAATGAVVWRNDGRMMGKGGTSTLGPLAFSYDHGKIYGTSAAGSPWALNPTSGGKTADLAGSFPDWFIDGSGVCQGSEPMEITAGAQTFTRESARALGVAGTVGSMLAGDGKLFVTTKEGKLYCFGGEQMTPSVYPNDVTPLPDVTDGWTEAVRSMLSRNDLREGLALVWGVGSGRLVEELAKQAPALMVVAVDPDPVKLRAIRVKMDAAGLSGARVSTLQGNPMECGFAPYQAALIASEDVGTAGFTNGQAMVKMLHNCTRPFGGEIWLPTINAQHTVIAGWITTATNMPLCEVARQTGFTGIGTDGFTQIKRTGLPDDKLELKPPFRLTAFGCNGYASMTTPSNGVAAGRDVYSWLPATVPRSGYEPSVPGYNNTLLGGKGYGFSFLGTMSNSLYSTMENPPYPFWSAACPGVKGYGSLRMCLGKTACFGDASAYWGMMAFPEIGGCCGPDGYLGDGVAAFRSSGGGSCNKFSLQGVMIGLTPVSDDEECWVNYRSSRSSRTIEETAVRRVGVNFGAVGDVYLPDEQMFWTHHPYYGRWTESAPVIPVSYRGNAANVYRHSAQMDGAGRATGQTGDSHHSWVAASQVKGMDGLTVHLASSLVALRTEIPPALDGRLTDACWDNRERVNISGLTGSCSTSRYVMLRYDAANLYVAGVMRGYASSGQYLKVALNSRERNRTAPALVLQATNTWNDGHLTEFSAEMAIPWASLEAAGLWKEQLIMNVELCGARLYGNEFLYEVNVLFWARPCGNLDRCFGPVYLDAARGPVMEMKPHKVRLYFAEMEDKPAGGRVFDVKLQRQTVLTNLDIAAEAGGPRREVVKEFQNVQIADKLDVDFNRKAGEPMLSGVEIMGTYSDSDLLPNVSPVALIDASAVSGPAPLEVTLSARRSDDPDGQLLECAWETGDGRLARGSLIRHVFAEPGTYKVNLLVTDNRGMAAATNVVVTVGAGAPSAFVCKIRASGGDYTNLVTWESALESDLTSSSAIFQVSSKGTYASTDNGRDVTFTGGGKGKLRWVATNTTPMIAAVANVAGTVSAGSVTISGGHTFTISDTGVAARSLLFTVSGFGNYVSAVDDGKMVTFDGGGVGILKHINGTSIAYIAECRGFIQTGTITCASGHTFNVADTGNPIHTVVAECYNDWTNGLRGDVKVAGWITDENHCVTIRPAPGNGHTGQLRDANGRYTGFTIVPTNSLDTTGAAHTRVERLMLDGGSLRIGSGGSVNRVCAGIAVSGTGAMIANSAGATFSAIQYPTNVAFYNCTGEGFNLAAVTRLRLVNCLSAPGGSGFSNGSGLLYRSHCVSGDGSATDFYLSEQALDGNLPNQAVSFADAARQDYHLAITDTGARGLGCPGLGADIDGDERIGPYYDVGADQSFGNHAPRITSGPAATPNPAGTGAVVRLSIAASDLDSDPMTCAWTFGDGGTASGTDVTHAYAGLGTYTTRVAVSDGTLATTGTVTVTVLGAFDLWRVEHFGSTNAPNGGASDDADGDGMSNENEFLAGTDPMNPDSALKLTEVHAEPAGRNMVLAWRSESNRWYWIGCTSNLMSGFTPVISNIPATYPINTRTVDVGSAEGGFFVIKLEQ